MKKILIVVLALTMLLCACGKKEPTPTTVATEPTTEATTEATTEPTEPPVLYRHPLTGEPLDEPFTGRPVAVSIGNTKAALPQHGIGNADVFFEIEAEGDITRFLPIFTDLGNTASIGPIRSARTFFNNVSAAYNAPIAHCGGSVRGIRGYYDLTGSKISDWEHFDQFSYGTKYFYRDSDRRSQGYAYEHTLFTTGENMLKALDDQEYQSSDAWDLGFRFDEETGISGTAATKITVSFLGGKTSHFTYDETTGLYAIEQYDRQLIDGTTGKQLTFKNVLVLYSPQTKQHDGYYSRSYYELIGSGEGYFAVDGQIVPIKWSREDVKQPFVYTLEDGTPITMGVGKTYIAISSPKSDPIQYQ